MAFFLLLAALSFWLSVFGVALMKHFLGRYFLDVPNVRSSHQHPVPRGCGLSFLLTFFSVHFITSVFLPQYNPYPLIPFWICLLPLIIVGLIDDLQGAPVILRLLAHFLTSGLIITHFGYYSINGINLPQNIASLLALMISILGIVTLINFYNFMDGLDGLVAGVSSIQIGFLAIYFNQPFLWLFVAALIGFLQWNWSPAKVFMGDVGSTSLGAILAIVLIQTSHQSIAPVSTLVIFLPFIGDVGYILLRRLLRGENIFKPHRTNLYHRLHHQAKWSHTQVTLLYMGSTGMTVLTLYYFHTLGAWITCLATLLCIGLSEAYLQWKGSVPFLPDQATN